MTETEALPAKRKKFNYVGAPAIFALESACQDINRAFDGFGFFALRNELDGDA